MEDSLVFEELKIKSHKGLYSVRFDDDILAQIHAAVPAKAHYLVDRKIAELYPIDLRPILESPSVLQIEALESNKSLEQCPRYVEHLIGCGIRRGHILVAIGGGIIQDITCFLAATLLRGLDWHFYPTTLLAQADSCIGSKSSINVGRFKNIVGTYTPPARIVVSMKILATLPEIQIRSGVGEMLKVHAIAGPEAFDQIACDYDRLLSEPEMMRDYILRSLKIKQKIIEQDEFDVGLRNVMNLGHSFGHAIESATNYEVPHGIAVTLGIDMAYYAAARFGLTSDTHFRRMHPTLAKNYRGYEDTVVALDLFLAAIAKDKKNTDTKLSLILPGCRQHPGRVACENNQEFHFVCREYFERIRRL